MTKVCRKCKQDKTPPEFSRKKRYKDGLNCWCKSCVNKYNRDRHAKNPEKFREADKKHYYKFRERRIEKSRGFGFKKKYWPHFTYKEALAEWDRLFKAQDGKCAICKKKSKLDVEHNHSTGAVRGLVCNGCNTALARIHEDFNIALSLAKYIMEHNGLPDVY